MPTAAASARALEVGQRRYRTQRVDGLPGNMVAPSAAELERIHREGARIAEVRQRDTDAAWFARGFRWPLVGTVTGVYGSQRILNGEPRRPHYGIDIAAPAGTAVGRAGAGDRRAGRAGPVPDRRHGDDRPRPRPDLGVLASREPCRWPRASGSGKAMRWERSGRPAARPVPTSIGASTGSPPGSIRPCSPAPCRRDRAVPDDREPLQASNATRRRGGAAPPYGRGAVGPAAVNPEPLLRPPADPALQHRVQARHDRQGHRRRCRRSARARPAHGW